MASKHLDAYLSKMHSKETDSKGKQKDDDYCLKTKINTSSYLKNL